MEAWTEKYRPQTLDDVIGNDRAVAALRNWGQQWNSSKLPRKRAVILSGKAGIGKTSCALALARDFRWIPIELNASDARNATRIKQVATTGALNESFDDTGQFISSVKGGRKLIILDEADNLYEKIEGGGQEGDLVIKVGKERLLIRLNKRINLLC